MGGGTNPAGAARGNNNNAGPQRPIFIHGNYHRYYGYRVGRGKGLGEDPRLSAFRPEWFRGRRVLDVGCNEGLVSLDVAARFHAAAVLGVDIDPQLVAKAGAALTRYKKHYGARAKAAAEGTGTAAASAGGGGGGGGGGGAEGDARAALRALAAVRFVQADLGSPAGGAALLTPGAFDVAMVLSVTKWIHFHVGDHGLKAFFHRLAAALSPGGLLILEPQPWRSYKSAHAKQDMSGAPFGELWKLQFRPEEFKGYLTGPVGFEWVAELTPGGAVKGFDRPLQVFRKPAAAAAVASAVAVGAAEAGPHV
jgi:7SK snRNA methylphosphate capping enzyme